MAAEHHRNRYADAVVERRPNASAPIEGKPALQRQIGDLPPLRPGGGTGDDIIRSRLAYEESARIPLMVRYPPLIPPGSMPGQLVMNIDLAPTLLELADAEPTRPFQGRSLVPLLRGETASDWRSSVLIEYYSDTVFRRIVNRGYKAVRTDRYKLIDYLELEDMDELYDLELDPYEMNNVITDSEYASVLEEMRRELQRLLEATT